MTARFRLCYDRVTMMIDVVRGFLAMGAIAWCSGTAALAAVDMNGAWFLTGSGFVGRDVWSYLRHRAMRLVALSSCDCSSRSFSGVQICSRAAATLFSSSASAIGS